MRKMKNKLSLVLAVLLVITCIIGSMAYFTDRVTAQAKITTTNDGVKITPEIDPEADPDDPAKDPEDFVDPTPTDPTDDLSNWWAYLNSVAKVNFNPGDKMDLSYKLTNSGNLDIKIRETFIVTSSVPMTDGSEQFKLCTAYASVPTGGVAASAYTGMTFEKLSSTQYKVTMAETELAAPAEGSTSSAAKDYYLVFAPTASNAFQKATCTINYVVEAMQADGDWATVVTGELVLNGQTLNVVPAA